MRSGWESDLLVSVKERYENEYTENMEYDPRIASLTKCQPNTNTRRLVVEEGGFKYDSDSYADDLPYWTLEFGKAATFDESFSFNLVLIIINRKTPLDHSLHS